MLQAYLNYPNSKVTVYGEPLCQEIAKMQKSDRRPVNIGRKSVD